ncbi:hypothetical protein R1flu_025828 [Riccia fluitans]|uniref:Uncharacterized protein n=1 Tax=Riccia fluitans TaxID=41844 RepID=A0ABD1XYV5_9MARC
MAFAFQLKGTVENRHRLGLLDHLSLRQALLSAGGSIVLHVEMTNKNRGNLSTHHFRWPLPEIGNFHLDDSRHRRRCCEE